MEIKGREKDSMFESVKNMIWKLALERFSKEKRPDMEFDDVLAEAYWIYSMCLANFDEGKGMKFTTYLYQNLKARLRDYYRGKMKPLIRYEEFNVEGKDGSVKSYEDSLVSPDYNMNDVELMQSAKEELSYEAFQVFKYILSREWESPRQKVKPTNACLAKHFGYTMELIESIMEEIGEFWNRTGWMVA